MKLKTVESPLSKIAELTVSPGKSGSRAAADMAISLAASLKG